VYEATLLEEVKSGKMSADTFGRRC